MATLVPPAHVFVLHILVTIAHLYVQDFQL